MFLHVFTRCFCVCFWLDFWCIWASILAPFWHRFGIQKHMFFVSNFQCFFVSSLCENGFKKGPKMTPKTALLAPKIHTFPQGGRFWEPLTHLGWFWRLFGRILVPFECPILALLTLFGTSLDFPGLHGVSARMLLSSLRAIANMPLHFCAFETSPPSYNPQSGSAGLAKRKQFDWIVEL